MRYGICRRCARTTPQPPLGRFRPGSWKKVRLITETLDDQGKVVSTSVARTRTTLTSLDDRHVTLNVEATVEVAGKEVPRRVANRHARMARDPASRDSTISDQGEESVTIGKVAIPCRIEQAENETAAGHVVTKTWYSDRVSPYVLRRESTTYEPDTEKVLSQTRVEVVAPPRSMRLLRRQRQAAELRVVHTHAGGTTRSRLWSSLEVPGGVVAQDSEEFDAEGRLARRSKLELVGFAAEFGTPAR